MPGLWLAITGLFWVPSAAAVEPFVISESMQGQALGLNFETLEDPEGRLELRDILRIDAEGGLKPSSEKVPNYGLKTPVQWVKFTIHNPLDQAVQILLENKFTYVDHFTIYHQDFEKSWQLKQAGDQLPFAKRDVQTRQAVFRFTLPPGSHLFYARSMAMGSHQLPLHIWTHDEFFTHNEVEYGFIGILIGFHVVICLYNLFLYFSLKDKTYFFYVAYVMFNVFYQATGLGLFQQAFSQMGLAETMSNRFLIVYVDLIAITALLFSYHFLNIKERLPAFRTVFQVIGVLDVLNILITVFVSVRLGTAICLVTASLVTSTLILSGFLIARQGYLPAVFYLVGWGCYLLGVTGTITNLIGLLPTSNFSRWGQFTGGALEIAILSLALGARINEKRKQTVEIITKLNQELENKVKERTAKIQTLLQHIPQGILSIGPEGLIDPNFSAQLPQILGHNEVSGQSFRRIVLDRSTLSDDEKDQAWQTLLASMGESSMNFEMNADKLPLQLHYSLNGTDKVLKLTWNFELDERSEIKHILVTLLDVSSEFAAQKEIERQNQEFEIIRQLVDIGSKKSNQFFNAGDQLITEIDRLLRASDLSKDSVKILFVNTHTLKGAARALQFRELANALHKVESYYSQIIKENLAIDQARALVEFASMRAVYHRYLKANTDILGRQDDLKKVSIDREFLHENVKLLTHLGDVDELSCELKDLIQTWHQELTQLIFMSLPMILEDILQQAEKIAKDLGREAPRIVLDTDDILVTYSQEMTLKNAFIHLLRNALDHGIEQARVRTEKGKAAQGTITVKAWEIGGTIYIDFQDDGKGLALGRIRTLTKAGPSASPAELAALIFATGFSTSDTVTQISGRGIGLDAVRQFFITQDGSVSIILGQPLDERGEFHAFSIRMSLPSIATKMNSEAKVQKSAV